MFSANDIRKCSEAEEKLADHVLSAATAKIKEQFDASENPGTLNEFQIERGPLVKAAQDETGAVMTPKVRVHMIDQAKNNGFNLDCLGGKGGKFLVLSFRRRGGGRPKKATTAPETVPAPGTEKK